MENLLNMVSAAGPVPMTELLDFLAAFGDERGVKWGRTSADPEQAGEQFDRQHAEAAAAPEAAR